MLFDAISAWRRNMKIPEEDQEQSIEASSILTAFYDDSTILARKALMTRHRTATHKLSNLSLCFLILTCVTEGRVLEESTSPAHLAFPTETNGKNGTRLIQVSFVCQEQ